MPGMRMNDVLHFIDHEDRCIRVVLLIFTVIQVLLMTALMLPEDPVILDVQPLPGFDENVQLTFESKDAALQNEKEANPIFPTDDIADNPTVNTTEKEDLVAAEPTNTSNIITEEVGYDPAGSVIISRASQKVLLKLYDQPPASGIGMKPSDIIIDVKEEYEFVPFPNATRSAKQTQPPNAIDRFGEKATTANEGKPVNATVSRFGQGWKDTIAGRFFKYGVADAKVNRPKPSAANDLGEREALPAMNGLALLPLLDRLYWAAQRERVRTAPVASAAAPAAAVQALAVACPLLLLLLKAKYCG